MPRKEGTRDINYCKSLGAQRILSRLRNRQKISSVGGSEALATGKHYLM